VPDRNVELYLNETEGSMFWAYTPKAMMRCAYRGVINLPDDNQLALSVLFGLFNRDQRPDGYRDRSLSVGDVVTLDSDTSWAVDAVGFTELDRVYTGDPLVGFEEWQASHPHGHRLASPIPFGTASAG